MGYSLECSQEPLFTLRRVHNAVDYHGSRLTSIHSDLLAKVHFSSRMQSNPRVGLFGTSQI